MLAPSLTQHAVLIIVAAASSSDERLGEDFAPESIEESNEVVNAHLDMWCQVIARGDWELFQQRLAWDGLDVDKVRRVLGRVRLRENVSLPSWANTLNVVLSL